MSIFEEGLTPQMASPLWWWAGVKRAARRDAVPYLIILLFAGVTLAISEAYGQSYWLLITKRYLAFAGVIVTIMLALRLIVLLAKERPASPIAAVATEVRQWFRPDVLFRVLLFFGIAVFTASFITVKMLLPRIHPFWFDPLAARIDRLVHLGHDPWTLTRFLDLWPPVRRVIEILYSPVWLLLAETFPLWVSVGCRNDSLRARFFLAYLMAWIVNGVIVAGLFMSGGPVYYGRITGDSAFFSGFTAENLRYVGLLFSAASEQEGVWFNHTHHIPGIGAGVSAFPSIHVTMVTLITLMCFSVNRTLGFVVAVYAATVVVSSVFLGWHYAIDGYFAIASTCGYWWLAGRWAPRMGLPARPGPPPKLAAGERVAA